MITAVHTLIYSDDAPATRAFLRDVLGWPFVDGGMPGEAWLIFATGPSEMGIHPTASVWEGKEYVHPRHHAISLMCICYQSRRMKRTRLPSLRSMQTSCRPAIAGFL